MVPLSDASPVLQCRLYFRLMVLAIRAVAYTTIVLPPQVAVVQFSNDVRVELPLEPLDRAAFHTLMASMVCTLCPVFTQFPAQFRGSCPR